MKDEDLEQVLAVNLTGAIRCARLAARGMVKRRWGRVKKFTLHPSFSL